MKFPIRLILTTLAVMTAIYILPGITAASFLAWLGTSVLISFANTVPKRMLLKLKIPMNLIVFGFLMLGLNIALTYLAAAIFPEFTASKFYVVLVFSIIVTSITSVMNSIIPSDKADNQEE